MKVFQKLSGKLAAFGSMLVAGAGSAFAAVPADVTTALTDASADTKTVAGLALAIMIGIAVFLWMRRAAR